MLSSLLMTESVPRDAWKCLPREQHQALPEAAPTIAGDGPAPRASSSFPDSLLPQLPAWSLSLQISQSAFSCLFPVKTPSLCGWRWPAVQEQHMSDTHGEAGAWMTWNNASLGISISGSDLLCVLGHRCLYVPWCGLSLLTSGSLGWGQSPASGL